MRDPSRVAGMGVHDEGTSPCLLKEVATRAQVPLHDSIISNFMIYRYQDRIETNFLWFLIQFLGSTLLFDKSKHNW